MSLMRAFIIIELEIGGPSRKNSSGCETGRGTSNGSNPSRIGWSDMKKTTIIHPWAIKPQCSLKKIIHITA